ncbi:hypothetical protein [Candidatus Laterigemmans baculatus]|uniref:hypothetical protein n=1 Tax=Candidatus Laterigemmans baculatus TaxID=2770505 RepID=UPI0013D942E9|nr:hypothetical protein [Candidatus Laterigemmans baculatus]
MKTSLPITALLLASLACTSDSHAQNPPRSNFGPDPFDRTEQNTEPRSGFRMSEGDPFGRTDENRKPRTEPRDSAGQSTRALEAKLQQAPEIQIGTVPLSKFVAELSQAIEAPVFLQSHSEWTEVNDETSITMETSGLPLAAELQKALRPHALQAIAHDGTLLIVPDTQELARRGIGTSRYVTLDDSYMQELTEKLSQSYSQSFNEIPLQDAVRILSTETGIKFLIDDRGLEDLGLTRDVPVKIDLSDISVHSFLQLMLRDADLTLMPRDGYVLVTTIEEAEAPENQIVRVYWLDGTGLSPETATEAIESVVEPDTWEMLGGPSSMVELNAKDHGRPGLVISTRYGVHRAIEQLLQSIRRGVVDPRTNYTEQERLQKGLDWRGSMSGMGMGMSGMGGPPVIGGPAAAPQQAPPAGGQGSN